MAAPPRRKWTRQEYEAAAQAYLEALPPEHFMEATPQATQREITVGSLSILRPRLSEPRLHYFSELLVQYFVEGNLRQVCPDNMVLLGDLQERDRTYYAPDEDEVDLFWTLEYVSPNTRRKDYQDNMQKYERELKVPYYLLFDPSRQDLRLYKLNGEYYRAERGGAANRYRIAELKLEMGLLDRWVRFWHEGELLPLPPELQAQLAQERQRNQELQKDLRDRDAQLRDRDQQLQSMTALLRPLVEVKARQAGRDDILTQLPAVDDAGQLTRWLAELG